MDVIRAASSPDWEYIPESCKEGKAHPCMKRDEITRGMENTRYPEWQELICTISSQKTRRTNAMIYSVCERGSIKI